MASNVRAEIISSGAIALLNGSEVQAFCLENAQRVESAAIGNGGGPYTTDVQPGQTRAHAMIKVDEIKAKVKEHKHNYLLKGMG